jgi:hypothetical protein
VWRCRTLVGHDATLPQGAHPVSALIWTRVTQILRLVHLVHQRVHLPLPVRIEPVRQSPRPLTERLFPTAGTGPCHGLTLWHPLSPPTPSRTAFPGAPLRPLRGHAGCLARASGTAPSSDFSPDPGGPFACSAYRPAFAQRSLHAKHPMRSPAVTPCSSAPCRPHTPWFEGWMDRAFVAIVPTRPCPLYGQEMVELLNSDPPPPGAWWSTRRDQFP